MQSNERLPNLIIPGAAKSGTTSLFRYLKQHPDVFMPPIKEPMYFVSEHIAGANPDNPRAPLMERALSSTLDEYKNLFTETHGQKVRGDATVAYLYHWKTAIPRILETLGDVHIIIMLRNPIDRAFSSYKNLLRDGHETVSFEDGLALEQSRLDAGWNGILFCYKTAGLYAEAVAAYQSSFSRVKVFLFDDFKSDSKSVFEESCEFLGIDPGFELENQRRHNSSLQPRNEFLKKALFRPSKLRSSLDWISRPFISEERKAQIILKLKKRASKDTAAMQDTTRAALQAYYRKDISRLEELLERDLSLWK